MKRVISRRTVLIASALSVLPAASYAESWSALPPPPALQNSAQRQQLMLELVVNQRERGAIIAADRQENRFWLRREDLLKAGLPAEKLPAGQIDVNALADVRVEYEEARQRLLLTVPPTWLPAQTLEQTGQRPRYPAQASNGALLNYDFYFTHASRSGSNLATWNELRLFGPAGQFSTNGVYRQPFSGKPDSWQQGYIRYDTWFSGESEDAVLSWRAGDLISDALSWSNSVRLGGLQVARDFSVRPDLITYPLPAFSGQAAVPSSVDLFINGYRSAQTSVQPGPWSLTNVPFVDGAGDAVITTTDAVGRQITTTIPFYVSSSLLKSGLTDYALSAGAVRQNYGIKNADYGAAAASGTYRYGISDWLTLESHAEGSSDVVMGGAGGLLKAGSTGVINAAIAQSSAEQRDGTQYSWGYQYNNSWFSIGTQHIIRSAAFSNLALASNRSENSSSRYSLARRSAQYNASLALDSYGSLGLAYLDISGNQNSRTRLLNLSWNKTLWGNSSLYISASRDRDSGTWTGAIALIVPFGEQGSAAVSVERNQQGRSNQRLFASRSMPSEGGIAWDASWARQGGDSGDYRQGSLRYRNNKIDTSAGIWGDDDNMTQWADLSGALVMLDNQVFAANNINDAFVLVKTGYPDVTVRYENQPMGRTDRQGYLLVPSVSSYYGARYAIDTLDLPASVSTPRIEQRVAIKRKSGFLLDFPVTPLRAASVILQDASHQPLPLASQVVRAGESTSYVGWDGIVWLENLQPHNALRVIAPDGRECRVTFSVDRGEPQALKTYGPLLCSLSATTSDVATQTGVHYD